MLAGVEVLDHATRGARGERVGGGRDVHRTPALGRRGRGGHPPGPGGQCGTGVLPGQRRVGVVTGQRRHGGQERPVVPDGLGRGPAGAEPAHSRPGRDRPARRRADDAREPGQVRARRLGANRLGPASRRRGGLGGASGGAPLLLGVRLVLGGRLHGGGRRRGEREVHGVPARPGPGQGLRHRPGLGA